MKLPLLQEGYETGLETGDLVFGAYCGLFDCLHLYFTDSLLSKITLKIKIYSDVLSPLKQENVLNYLCKLQQVIDNLVKQVENPGYLLGEHCNEEYLLPIYLEANDRCNLYYLYLDKLILNYLFENDLQAVECASRSEPYLDGVLKTFAASIFYFYDSLVQVRLYYSAPFIEQEQLLLRINNNQEKIQKWSHSAPTNFQHKYDLVEAEKARVLGRFLQAEEFYEQAIQGARENEYLQEEALAEWH